DGAGLATGVLALADVETVALHANVRQLHLGSPMDPLIDTSVVDIDARGDVWDVNSSGAFTGTHRGAGVVIGIIDSGIDFRHSFFHNTGSSPLTTRIKRIWDQGLHADTGAGEQPPRR